MGFWNRLKNVFAAEANSVLEGMEDPVKMMDQMLRHLDVEIHNAERAVIQQMTLENNLKRKAEDARREYTHYANQAQAALLVGNEDLTRKNIAEKLQFEQKALSFEEEYNVCLEASNQLKEQFRRLKQEAAELRHKRDILVAQAVSAKARKQIHKTLSGLGENSAIAEFNRFEQKIRTMQSESDAYQQLSDLNPSLRDENRKIGDNRVEQELAAMKAGLAPQTTNVS